MALRAHLWTQSAMPIEYLELVLCRDIYHCTPANLPDWQIITEHLALMSIESEVNARKAKRK